MRCQGCSSTRIWQRRAGAGSLSELAVTATPAVLVPFPQAADKHQDANAVCAAALGGAVIVHQHSPEHFASGIAFGGC